MKRDADETVALQQLQRLLLNVVTIARAQPLNLA